ncbi:MULTISPECIES: hypothetical protein [Clostridium]|uniref:Uncharacterized protein n=1 Tax=Clostridium cibarium TaxID=2762247 RepID=A0ABR8PSG6_9CLOT|nr:MULTISPECIES: hypothetical protein [Clostridium]MBD7911120.1 hypothetical protein [Clostridium cibarium]
MSSSWESKTKKEVQSVKSRSLFDGNLIQCNEEKKSLEDFESMRNGYIEMGQINLQLAIDNESELADIKNYETWLCGV